MLTEERVATPKKPKQVLKSSGPSAESAGVVWSQNAPNAIIEFVELASAQSNDFVQSTNAINECSIALNEPTGQNASNIMNKPVVLATAQSDDVFGENATFTLNHPAGLAMDAMSQPGNWFGPKDPANTFYQFDGILGYQNAPNSLDQPAGPSMLASAQPG